MAIRNSPDNRGSKTVIDLIANILSSHERKSKFARILPSLQAPSTNRLLKKST